MLQGYDVDLIKSITSIVEIPLIASGGMGSLKDVIHAVIDGGADAISMASVLHYNKFSIDEIRKVAIDNKIKAEEQIANLKTRLASKVPLTFGDTAESEEAQAALLERQPDSRYCPAGRIECLGMALPESQRDKSDHTLGRIEVPQGNQLGRQPNSTG